MSDDVTTTGPVAPEPVLNSVGGDAAIPGITAEQLPPGRHRIRRFLREQPFGAVALVLVVLLFLAAIFAPVVAPYDPIEQHRATLLQVPDGQFLMGTDDLGRDVLSRVIYGARTSLLIALATLVIGGLIGVALGVLSGYLGGLWIDTVIQRGVDTLMAIPAIVLLLFIAALLGPSIRNTIIALTLLVIPAFARVAHGEMLRVREEPYIEAARAVGCSTPRILWRYALPNLVAPLLVMASLLFANVMIAEAALSFLGIGTPPPTPSWGRMLSEGAHKLEIAPWVTVFPGLVLSLAVLAFNLLGDAARDFFDPKQQRR